MFLSLRLFAQAAGARAWIRSFEGGSVTLRDLPGDVKVLLLQHDNKRNAITGKMMVDFDDAVKLLEKAPPRALILRGAGQHFCSGWDLNFVQRVASPQVGEVLCNFMQETTARFQALPCPSVALIEGFAVGGGAEMAVCCDWRVMTSRALLEFKQARMGVTTGVGGTLRLVRLLGRTRALQVLLAGWRIGAEDALKMGLADHVIEEEEEPLAETIGWVEGMFGDVRTELVHAVKSCVHAVDSTSSESELLAAETAVFKSVWGGPVQLEVLRKVKEAFENKKSGQERDLPRRI